MGCPCLAEPCLSHLGLSQGREEERWPHDHTGRTAESKVAMFSRWVQTLTTAGVHSAISGRRTRSFHSGFPEDMGVTGGVSDLQSPFITIYPRARGKLGACTVGLSTTESLADSTVYFPR